MAENRHTMQELKLFQSLPLEVKIAMTKDRIRGWVDMFGEDGVYVSFSGGKDSTVLLHMVREEYPNIPAVFVDVPTQFPELREFVKGFENVEILTPKMNFKQVCETYGFPLISKDVSETVYYSRKYISESGISNLDEIPEDAPCRLSILLGRFEHKEKGVPTGEISKLYNKSKYKFMLEAPFGISSKCCKIMKTKPIREYSRKTGKKPIIGVMAMESKLRQQQWIKNGCNAFDSPEPISKPMSFWTEQDVLQYIKKFNIPICSVYGDVVEIKEHEDDVEGQLTISDLEGWEDAKEYDAKRPQLKTTGCERTGCVLCGFGCHLEKGEGRFEMLKKTHPAYYSMLDFCTNNGVTYRQAIEWVNEHGGFNIKL